MKSNRYLYLAFLLFILPGFALAAEEVIDPSYMSNFMKEIIFGLGLLTILGALAYLAYFNSKMIEYQEIQAMKEAGLIPEDYRKTYVEKESLWSKFTTYLSGLKPIEREETLMLDHEYDGIRELDNSLPPWWVGLFWITVIIAPIYIWYYHFSDRGVSQLEEYQIAMRQGEDARIRYLAMQTSSITEKNVIALEDAALLEEGKVSFIGKCAACHGNLGEGGIGPNLTDDYWIHGGDIKSVFKTIKYGVPDKGMIAWKAQMPPDEMQKVASYIMTLKGTNPPNGKAPQGELFIRETPQDSVIGQAG